MHAPKIIKSPSGWHLLTIETDTGGHPLVMARDDLDGLELLAHAILAEVDIARTMERHPAGKGRTMDIRERMAVAGDA